MVFDDDDENTYEFIRFGGLNIVSSYGILACLQNRHRFLRASPAHCKGGSSDRDSERPPQSQIFSYDGFRKTLGIHRISEDADQNHRLSYG